MYLHAPGGEGVMEKQVNADKGGGVQATLDVHIFGLFEPTFWMIRMTKKFLKNCDSLFSCFYPQKRGVAPKWTNVDRGREGVKNPEILCF